MGSREFAASCCLLGLVFASGPPTAGAAGAIDTTGANLTVGAGTPSGTVEIDADADTGTVPTLPSLGDLGSIGSRSGSLPAFPGAGTGADGAFAMGVDTALAGDTFHFTSYTVSNGAAIDYAGSAIIHVTGDVSIDGIVRTVDAGANVEFRCGGNFELLSDATTPNAIDVSGAGASITIHVADDAMLGSGGPNDGAVLETDDGAVRVVAHGITPGGGDIVTDRLRIIARQQPCELQAAQSVQLGPGSLFAGGGFVVESFGAGIASEAFLSTSGANVVFESALGITLSGGGTIDTSAGAVTVRAFAGNLVIDNAGIDAGDDSVAHASGDVQLRDGGSITSGSGAGDVRAFGGDVLLGAAGGRSSRIDSGTGHLTVMAMRDVLLANSRLESSRGDLIVRAFGGTARLDSDSVMDTSDGLLDVRATTSIAIDTGNCVAGGTLHMSAGDGGIDVTSSELNADDASADLLSSGPVRLRTSIFCDFDVMIRSTGGDVDVSDSSARTERGRADPSGSIAIEVWQPACILAANADLTTGTSNVQSGDVRLLARNAGGGGGGGGGPPNDVRSYFLPKTVKVKLNAGKPERSLLAAAGFFDVGPGNPDLSGEATLDVGGLSVTANLETRPNGRVVRLREGGFDFLIKRSGAGSSRAKFRLKVRRDFAGQVPTEGDLALRFRRGAIDGSGRVSLEEGRFKLGRKRGLLTEPVVFPFRAKATAKGGGKDRLVVLAGISTDGAFPANAPVTMVTFGDLALTVASDDFTSKTPGVFFAKNPTSAPGVKKVTVDYVRETVSLSAKDVDLGVVAEGPFDVVLGVQLGDAQRTVEVTATRKGTKVRY